MNQESTNNSCQGVPTQTGYGTIHVGGAHFEAIGTPRADPRNAASGVGSFLGTRISKMRAGVDRRCSFLVAEQTSHATHELTPTASAARWKEHVHEIHRISFEIISKRVSISFRLP